MHHRLHFLPGFLLGLTLLAMAVMALPSGSAAMAYAQQLPPRPTLTPTSIPATATPTATAIFMPTATATAVPVEQPVQIRLVVDAEYKGAWSLVQWQGGDGVWHDVSGWLGQIENGQVQWRVLPKDYDSGPFRWIVLDQPGGEILAASASFRLPNAEKPLLEIPVDER